MELAGLSDVLGAGNRTLYQPCHVNKGTRALTLHIDQQCWQPSGAIKLNQMLSLKPCEGAPPQWRLYKDGDYTITVDTRSGTPTLLLSIKLNLNAQRSSPASVPSGMVRRSRWMLAKPFRKER